jgi:D-glycero-alpha-D-manno-heptose-7-phosphate kinase
MVECIRSRAPLRISFCGGGTDVAPFPEREGGCVLSATINMYAYVTLVPRTDRMVCAESLDFGTSFVRDFESLQPDGTMDLVQTTLRVMAIDSGADLYLHTDAPPGSGLGSSSTMVVALVGLVNEWRGLSLTPHVIAEQAYTIERVNLQIPGGAQDQYAACFGGFNFIEFYSDHVVVNPLRLRSSTLNELSYSLSLFFTGRTREGGRIIETQTNRVISNNQEAVTALRELKSLTVELKRQLLMGDIPGFGRTLDLAWTSKRRLAPGITNAYLDEVYEIATRAGAWGGKLLGAGGGGYLLVAAPYRARQRIIAELASAGAQYVPFSFESDGLVTWRASTG